MAGPELVDSVGLLIVEAARPRLWRGAGRCAGALRCRSASAAAACPASSIRSSATRPSTDRLDHAAARMPRTVDASCRRTPISPMRARRRQRGAQPRRQGHQPALGKSRDRRARHRHADRHGLYPGWPDLPRFPRELRAPAASQSWLQGEACRSQQGAWEVRTPEALAAVLACQSASPARRVASAASGTPH